MEISLIYVLIIAEIIFVLVGLSITFFILWLRKPKPAEGEPLPVEDSESELDAIDLGSSYIDYLDQAIEHNSSKLQQTKNSKDDDESELSDTSPLPTEVRTELLQAREQFLLVEKEAAEQTEQEVNFWNQIYSGMQTLIEKYKTTEVITEVETTVNVETKSKEKVVYIETQGKKIDGEVNKLKDIIYEQENALSSMKKALESTDADAADDSPVLATIKQQLETLERQLSDSKMCMEVLEMENNRLQEEVDKMGSRHDALFEPNEDEEAEESTSMIDLDQMKEVMAEQEAKINQLIETIDSLEIEASQAEKLKETLSGFTRTSKEMMSCITILEEENERLQEVASHTSDGQQEADVETAPVSSDEETAALQSKVSALEEEIIKKDVSFAQLQDEFSSMETEYLAMYEAMHNSGQ